MAPAAQAAPIGTPAATRSGTTEPQAESSPCRISVAIPVFNEEHGVAELLRRVGAVLDSIPGGPHQIVVVNDGSTDRTFEHLEMAARADHRLVVVSLSRNFGHQAALTAALDHVNGDVAVLMDGDLQDPPEAIPDFVRQYQSGADVVYAQRVRRKESWPLRLSYYVFYRLMLRMSNVPLPLDAGDFGLMSRRVIDSIRSAPERHRFLRGLRSWAGFRQVGIAVERGDRYAGSSKYSLLKLMHLASDGMFAFSTVPLRLASAVGAISIALAMVFAAYQVYVKLWLHESPQGFTSLTVLIIFFGGLNLLFLGLIGEYLGRVYDEVKSRPVYVIDRVVRHPECRETSES